MTIKDDSFIELPLGVLAIFLVAVILGVWIEFALQQPNITATSLINLDKQAVALAADKNRDQVTLPNFYVADGYALVAFDANQQAVRDACTSKAIVRPAPCGTDACICVCAEESGCRGIAVNCRRLKGIESITMNTESDNFIGEPKSTGGNGLLVYGDCGVGDASMRPTTLYLYFNDADHKRLVVDTQQKLTAVNLDKSATT